jgi:plastocyanin
MRTLPALVSAALLALAAGGPVAADHCASTDVHVTPLPGEPGAYLVETPLGPRIARPQARPTRAGGEPVVVRVLNFAFDVDNDPVGTPHDTIEIPAGGTVRWELSSGFHTVTSGSGSADPEAGAFFDATLFSTVPTFEMTFDVPGTYDYFCAFHELQNMKGTVVVTPAASVPNPAIVRTGFARPPAPNPTRRDVSFVIAMAEEAAAVIEILDAAGRRVSSIHRGALPPGEHTFRWDGRGAGGRIATAGVYLARLRAGAVAETRAFSLLR